MVNSTRKAAGVKPKKPYKTFPLFAHRNGQWAKTIKYKTRYFGPWDDPDGALKLYNQEAAELAAGKEPPSREGAVRLHHVINKFLNFKKAKMESGEITERTFHDYCQTGKDLANKFRRDIPIEDITQEMFSSYRKDMSKKWSMLRLNNEITRIRSIFIYALQAGLVPKAMTFGPEFTPASKKTLRIERGKKPKRLFDAETVRTVLAAARQPLKAMVLLGINCGFGNGDCGDLPIRALDLAGGWITFPRPKTGIDRRCKLWPETVEALEAWLKIRPRAKSPADEALVFITKYGGSFRQRTSVKKTDDDDSGMSVSSAIGHEFGKLLVKLGIKKDGVNYYSLRHTFRTVAGRAKDPEACHHVMGHESGHVSSVYIEGIGDDRLEEIATVVRWWLFPHNCRLKDVNVSVIGQRPAALAHQQLEDVLDAEIVDQDEN